MENDERLMEHTEKVVAEMLKFVLAPNEMRVDDDVEFVIIDEIREMGSTNLAMGTRAAAETSTAAAETVLKDMLSQIEIFLDQGLDKIRAEYPMYAVSTNAYLCQNCGANGLQQESDGCGINNNWFTDNNFENVYPNEDFQRSQICTHEIWNDEDEWPVVGNLPRRVKRLSSGQYVDRARENSEESSEEEAESDGEASNVSVDATAVQEQARSENCAPLTNSDLHINEGLDVTTMPAFTTPINHFELSQQTAALHQTHSTTTTTTAFGVVHQQTSSSTTTNFLSNHLSNAALVAPAALYTQALLTQQWTAFLKDAQQRYMQQQLQQTHTPIINCASHCSSSGQQQCNINASIYERFAYAQWLQQQIFQQQQQVTIALLQQQKIALQNNIAAAAVAHAANSNLFAQAASVIGSTYGNTFAANFSMTANAYGGSAASLETAANAINMNLHLNTNSFAVATKNELPIYYTGSQQNRNSQSCTPINSAISIDSFNLHAAVEHQATTACPVVVAAKISHASHD